VLHYDPHSHELHEDPYPVYAQLREEAPVYRNERHAFWAISRFDDVVHGLQHTELFTSTRAELASDPSQSMPMMIVMDPPRHDELRSLVNHSFTPRRMKALATRVRELSSQFIDRFVERGSCDLYADFSAPLPTAVIAALLGVPESDSEFFKEKSTAVVAAAGPVGGDGSGAAFELARYLAGIFEEKRKRPGPDLLSELLAAEVAGRRLTQGELLGFAVLLLIAGNETTTNLISNGTLLLDRHPDVRRALARDPSRIPAAVEEMLRFDPPIQGIERRLTRPQVVQGQRVEAGDKVFLLVASANRDPRRIERPDDFDITRSPNRHLSFGWGTHFCLGASLARLEARIAFEELLARLPEFHVSGPVKRLHADVIRGLLALPLEFRAAA
jgi:cytochrome P450